MDSIDTLTITSDPNGNYHFNTVSSGVSSITGAAGSTYTIGNIANTISSINISDYKVTMPEEWVNCFPDFDRIEKMCKEYPGLKIAYDQFKTVYALVRDDYDTPKDQRVKP